MPHFLTTQDKNSPAFLTAATLRWVRSRKEVEPSKTVYKKRQNNSYDLSVNSFRV